MSETNIHHLHWTRKEHNRYKVSSLVRGHELSQMEMLIPIHGDLHFHCPPVHAPSYELGRTVLTSLMELPSRYSALDAAKSLRDELEDTDGQYLSDHLGRQIPFLELSARALKQRRV